MPNPAENPHLQPVGRLPPTVYLEDHNEGTVVVHVVDNPKWANPDPPGMVFPANFAGARWPWGVAEGADGDCQSPKNLRGKSSEVALRYGSQLNPVWHGLAFAALVSLAKELPSLDAAVTLPLIS